MIAAPSSELRASYYQFSSHCPVDGTAYLRAYHNPAGETVRERYKKSITGTMAGKRQSKLQSMPDIWTEKCVRNARNGSQPIRSIRRNHRIKLPQICRKDAPDETPENNAMEGSGFQPKEDLKLPLELIADVCGIGDQGVLPNYVDPVRHEHLPHYSGTSTSTIKKGKGTQGMAVKGAIIDVPQTCIMFVSGVPFFRGARTVEDDFLRIFKFFQLSNLRVMFRVMVWMSKVLGT